ncbi:hypothetical protein O1L68_38360 [Streptomyces lydicus]|nr:hypothetical protein [Streptomyces lydicus]
MTVVLATLHGEAAGHRARTAVCPDGGGHGAIAADAAETAGLAVPELGPAAQQRLRTLLWEQSAVGNPVDLAGMGSRTRTPTATPSRPCSPWTRPTPSC